MVLYLYDTVHQFIRLGFQRRSGFTNLAGHILNPLHGHQTGNRLDTTDTRCHAPFGNNLEETDIACTGNVCTPT